MAKPTTAPKMPRLPADELPGTLGWASELLAIGGLVALVALLVGVIA